MGLSILKEKSSREGGRKIAEASSNREGDAREVVEECGGNMRSFYDMLGQDYHIAIIVEYDDLPSYLGTVITTVLGGAIADFKTIVLYNSDDVVKASAVYQANKASYSPPAS